MPLSTSQRCSRERLSVTFLYRKGDTTLTRTLENIRLGLATLVAAGALLALSAGPALAAPPDVTQATVQTSAANTVGDGNQGEDAQIEGWAFQHATGLDDLNLAAGIANQQANSVVIVDSPSLAAYTAATVQTGAGSTYVGLVTAGPHQQSALEATIQDNAFQYFEGVVNANLAAGDGNQQSNTLGIFISGPDTFDTIKQ